MKANLIKSGIIVSLALALSACVVTPAAPVYVQPAPVYVRAVPVVAVRPAPYFYPAPYYYRSRIYF